MKSYNDFCEKIVAEIFEVIDKHGGLLQWKKAWNVTGCPELPVGGKGIYRGTNLFCLWMEQFTKGWKSNQWMTFLQIKQQGGYVLKGAKAVDICFWKLVDSEQLELSKETESNKQIKAVFKMYKVFNFDQTSLAGKGAPILERPRLSDLISKLSVNISQFGNQPSYIGNDDVIVMPLREHFNCPEDYDVTLMHELVHWTGCVSRLNRKCYSDYGISDAARAEEELIAEMGSVFLASHFGLGGTLTNHASYIASWKKHLDAKTVARAVSQASLAFQWLLSHINQEEAAA